MLRDERTDLVTLLDALNEQRKSSRTPEVYDDVIRRARKKLLALYRKTISETRLERLSKTVPLARIAPTA